MRGDDRPQNFLCELEDTVAVATGGSMTHRNVRAHLRLCTMPHVDSEGCFSLAVFLSRCVSLSLCFSLAVFLSRCVFISRGVSILCGLQDTVSVTFTFTVTSTVTVTFTVTATITDSVRLLCPLIMWCGSFKLGL